MTNGREGDVSHLSSYYACSLLCLLGKMSSSHAYFLCFLNPSLLTVTGHCKMKQHHSAINSEMAVPKIGVFLSLRIASQ